jgi:hypothetical protein
MNWTPKGTVDEAEQEMDDILVGIIDKYVKKKKPRSPGPTPWWNSRCNKAFKWKQKRFEKRNIEAVEYSRAVKFSRKVQKKAYGAYQRKIKSKLNTMSTGDGNFWSMVKEMGGLESSKGQATPSAEDLADHFAEKMSNGKDVEDDDYVPKRALPIPLSSFEVCFKTVEKVLKEWTRRNLPMECHLGSGRNATSYLLRAFSSSSNISSRKLNGCLVGRLGGSLLLTKEGQ